MMDLIKFIKNYNNLDWNYLIQQTYFYCLKILIKYLKIFLEKKNLLKFFEIINK